MIGKKILNYEITTLLGEGGMGNVYLAEHLQLDRKVAIKMLHPRLAANEALRKRFKNEALAMSKLNHPNIVALHDYLESEDGLFLIMEYVSGKELEVYIRDESGPVNSEDAIHFMKQILGGVAYAHAQGIVHRDIKPSNILFTEDKKIKILDFGIAKLLDADKKLTKTGMQMGTVLYMSPEQVKGKKIDQRTDIYSLGVTFFQMLTGQSPYATTTTEFEVYTQIVNDPLPKASSIYPGVSEKFEAIIAKATAKEPIQRFGSCEEMLKSLSGEVPNLSSLPQSNISLHDQPFEILKRNRQLFSKKGFAQIAPDILLKNIITYLDYCFKISAKEFVVKYGKVQFLYDYTGKNKYKGGILISQKAVFIVLPKSKKRVGRFWDQINGVEAETIPDLNSSVRVTFRCHDSDLDRRIRLDCANPNVAQNIKDLFEKLNS